MCSTVAVSASATSPVSDWLAHHVLVCPQCRSPLQVRDRALTCADGHRYPVADGRPVLIPDAAAFTVEQVADRTGTYFDARAEESLTKARWRRRLPALGRNRRATTYEDEVARAIVSLPAPDGARRGVVIGCGERGASRVARHGSVEWLLTDVDLHYGAQLAADVMSLPLADASVDVVVAEHVLEHVLDPVRAAREIERVLRPGGLVVATAPFAFPWHGAPIDFFRMTASGMRALFRGCEVAYLAPGMGDGSALGYGVSTALTGVGGTGRLGRRVRYVAVRLAVAPLKHLDRFGRTDGRGSHFAAEHQLLARRVEHVLTDREVLADVRARYG